MCVRIFTRFVPLFRHGCCLHGESEAYPRDDTLESHMELRATPKICCKKQAGGAIPGSQARCDFVCLLLSRVVETGTCVVRMERFVLPACSLDPPTHPHAHPSTPQDAILSIATTFDLDTDDVIPTSAKTGEGVDEASDINHGRRSVERSHIPANPNVLS